MATGGGEERNALTILWRIENLSYFRAELDMQVITSPYFSCDDLLRRYYMAFNPRGYCDEDEHMYLSLFRVWGNPLELDCEFSMMACDGSPLFTRKGVKNVKDARIIDAPNCPTQEEVFVTRKTEFLPGNTLTIQCRIWKTEGNLPCADFISCCSRIEVAENVVLWPILGFHEIKLLQHETFPLDLDFKDWSASFELNCSLAGDSLHSSQLDVEVTPTESMKKCVVKLQVSVLGNGQEVIRLEEREHVFVSRTMWVVPNFTLSEDLPRIMSVFSCDESLHLRFHVTGISEKITESVDPTYVGTYLKTVPDFTEVSCQTAQQSDDNSVYALQRDYHSMYRDQKFSDFELRSGDVSFPVHKVILSGRSPVFRSMFSNEMQESNSKSLDIPDLDALTLDRLLTFLYAGTMDLQLTLESAAKLYYAADKYQVDSLKSYCSSILQTRISVSNVSDVLILADRHQDSNLMSFAQNFIRRHLDRVTRSEDWEKFVDLNPVLAEKSMHLFHKKMKKSLKD